MSPIVFESLRLLAHATGAYPITRDICAVAEREQHEHPHTIADGIRLFRQCRLVFILKVAVSRTLSTASLLAAGTSSPLHFTGATICAPAHTGSSNNKI